jgi:ABC-type thiamin/hydroxymethylpyrimidine transport system permease subunit
MQTRAVLYGIWSIAFCVAAYLAAKGDMSLLNDIVGVSSRWIVFGFIGAAIVSMLLMQRQIRDIRKVKT